MDNSLPAFYRTSDPIDNLLVRVSIRKKSSVRDPAGELALKTQATLSFAPRASGPGALTSTGLFDDRSAAGQENEAAIKTFEFSWQQKVYGPRELLKYANAIIEKRAGRVPTALNSSSPVEAEYLADIERRLNAGEPLFEAPASGIMLFTMTDRDGYSESSRTFLDGGQLGSLPLPLPSFTSFSDQWQRLAGRGLGGPGVGLALGSGVPMVPGVALPGSASVAAPPAPPSLPPQGRGRGQGIADAVSSPLAGDARGVFAHAYKENPYSTMYVIAAVGVDPVRFRSGSSGGEGGMWWHEVPLLCVRSFGGGRVGAGSALLEMRPGFSEYVPYDRASLIALTRTINGESPASGLAAAAALERADTVLGQGRFGGAMRLRQLKRETAPAHADGAASAIEYEREGSVLGYSLECHSFSSPIDGALYEYSVVNPDEDIAAILAKVSARGTAGSGVHSRWAGRRGRGGDDADDDEGGLSLEGVPGELATEEARAIERAANRVPSEFYSALPQGLHLGSFALHLYLDIVAAARFAVGSGLLGTSGPSLAALLLPLLGQGGAQSGVYVSYEVVLPKGCGWRVLPTSDVPTRLGSGTGGAVLVDGEASDEDEGNVDYDYPTEVEGNESGEEGEGGEVDAAEGAVSDRTGLRQRMGAQASGSSGDASPPPGRVPTPTARIHKRRPRRWLRSVASLTGCTQVAGFCTRPWTFGTPSASRPTGVFAASVGPGTETASGAERHPFDFSAGMGQAASGYERIDGKASNRASARGGARADGSGSVSLVSGIGLDEGPSGCLHRAGQTPCGSAVWDTPVLREADKTAVAHIGHPLSLRLLCDAGRCVSPSGPRPPQLFLTVMSRDGWDRHRVEGYAWMEIPMTAGSRDVVLTAWRPQPVDNEAAQTDFFLGGSTRLSDVTYARIPSTWTEHTAGAHGDAAYASAVYEKATSKARKAFASLVGSATGLNVGQSAAEAQAQAAFAGGAALPSAEEEGELGSVSPDGMARGAPVASLNRLGFTTVSAGEVGVRVHCIKQRYPPGVRPEEESAGVGAGRSRTAHGAAGVGATARGSLISAVGSRTVDEIIAEAKAIRKRDRERVRSTVSGMADGKQREGGDDLSHIISSPSSPTPPVGSASRATGDGPGQVLTQSPPEDKNWTAGGPAARRKW